MKPILIQTGPNTWAVQYPADPAPARRAAAPKTEPAKRRKRYLVEEPRYGYRPNFKRYATAAAADQAKECFAAREKSRLFPVTLVTAVR